MIILRNVIIMNRLRDFSQADNVHPMHDANHRISRIKFPPFGREIWAIWFFVVVVLKKLTHQQKVPG